MNDLTEDLSKKLIGYLKNKKYKTLQFEVEMLGDVEKQHPSIIFCYANSIYFNQSSEIKDLIYASSLFENIYFNNKNNLRPLYSMIAVSFKTKVFKRLLPLVLSAYEKNKQDVILIEGLARINRYLGNREVSIKFFRKLYKILPDKEEGRLPFISSFNYTSNTTQEQYMEECLKYTSFLEKKLNIHKDSFQCNFERGEKIKICFLSSDLKTHSVSFFLLNLLENIDQTKFDISLVSNLKISEQDSMSDQFKKIVRKWYDVKNFSNNELVNLLRSFELDFLIDLNGFTTGNRFEVLLRRCAKNQILWLGYNNSLGATNVDFLISDKNLIQPNELHLYKEKILFLPNIWNVLSVPKNIPEIKTKKTNEETFFCSFNNFLKISESTIEVWSHILKKTGFKILLKNSSRGGDDLQDNILEKFLKRDIQRNQIVFCERTRNINHHLDLYNRASVALDTFPYPGVTTSFEAIMMGLPVLTMKGYNFNSRCGESINKNIEMTDLIAENNDDYIKKAILLTQNKNLDIKYGNNLRTKALNSPLFNTNQFTKDFENLITSLYKNETNSL